MGPQSDRPQPHISHSTIISPTSPAPLLPLAPTIPPQAGEKTIAEMRADVTKELEKAAAAEESIPLTMSLGLFTVSCAAVRKFVVDHHRNLALEIPKVLARRVRAKGDELKEQFQEIARALHKKPTNVEEVAELEEYASRDSNRGRGRRPSSSLPRASPPPTPSPLQVRGRPQRPLGRAAAGPEGIGRRQRGARGVGVPDARRDVPGVLEHLGVAEADRRAVQARRRGEHRAARGVRGGDAGDTAAALPLVPHPIV